MRGARLLILCVCALTPVLKIAAFRLATHVSSLTNPSFDRAHAGWALMRLGPSRLLGYKADYEGFYGSSHRKKERDLGTERDKLLEEATSAEKEGLRKEAKRLRARAAVANRRMQTRKKRAAGTIFKHNNSKGGGDIDLRGLRLDEVKPVLHNWLDTTKLPLGCCIIIDDTDTVHQKKMNETVTSILEKKGVRWDHEGKVFKPIRESIAGPGEMQEEKALGVLQTGEGAHHESVSSCERNKMSKMAVLLTILSTLLQIGNSF
eukprot:GHVN01072827.1.p1 GENE.GHVN01072827.1~~GHVN01072827.1.p1  ORF type:complete len:262 (+),score=22.79 GHVN01072827.1:161-946(+)